MLCLKFEILFIMKNKYFLKIFNIYIFNFKFKNACFCIDKMATSLYSNGTKFFFPYDF